MYFNWIEVVLVRDNSSYDISPKAKEFYTKNETERIESPARSPDLNQ